MRNNAFITFLGMRYRNQFGISKVLGGRLSETGAHRITAVGYVLLFLFVMFYFIGLPIQMQYTGTLQGVHQYVVGLLFWGFSIWTFLSGIDILFLNFDREYMLTLPLKHWQARMALIVYHYVIQECIAWFVFISFHISLYVIHPIPLVNLFHMSIYIIALPILSMCLSSVSVLSVRLLFRNRKKKYRGLQLLLSFLLLFSPLIYYFSKSGVLHPIDGMIQASLLRYSLVDTLEKGQWTILLYFSLVSFVCTILGSWIILNSYDKIVDLSIQNTYNQSTAYRLSTATPYRMLLKNEVKRYLTSLTYMANTLLLPILLLVLSFLFIFTSIGNDISFLLWKDSIVLSREAQYVIAFLGCLTLAPTTTAAFSIEGKTLWILQTFPISIWDVSKVKLSLNLLIFLPGSILSWVSCFYFQCSYIEVFQFIILLQSTLLFSTLIGLFLNFSFPKYDFGNEHEVVKQGLPVLLMSCISMMFLTLTSLLLIGTKFIYTGWILIIAEVGGCLYIRYQMKKKRYYIDE